MLRQAGGAGASAAIASWSASLQPARRDAMFEDDVERVGPRVFTAQTPSVWSTIPREHRHDGESAASGTARLSESRRSVSLLGYRSTLAK